MLSKYQLWKYKIAIITLKTYGILIYFSYRNGHVHVHFDKCGYRHVILKHSIMVGLSKVECEESSNI